MHSLNATLRVLEYFLLGPWRGTDTPERGGKRSPAGPQWQDTLTPELRGREGRDRWQGRGGAERLQGRSRTQIRGRRPTPAPPPARARPWAAPSAAPRPAARGIWPRPFRPRPRGSVGPNPLLLHLGSRPVPLRPRPSHPTPQPRAPFRGATGAGGAGRRGRLGPRPPPGSQARERDPSLSSCRRCARWPRSA